MKKVSLYLIMLSLICYSCNKQYSCKNADGNATGQTVKAASQKAADKKCNEMNP